MNGYCTRGVYDKRTNYDISKQAIKCIQEATKSEKLNYNQNQLNFTGPIMMITNFHKSNVNTISPKTVRALH